MRVDERVFKYMNTLDSSQIIGAGGYKEVLMYVPRAEMSRREVHRSLPSLFVTYHFFEAAGLTLHF